METLRASAPGDVDGSPMRLPSQQAKMPVMRLPFSPLHNVTDSPPSGAKSKSKTPAASSSVRNSVDFNDENRLPVLVQDPISPKAAKRTNSGIRKSSNTLLLQQSVKNSLSNLVASVDGDSGGMTTLNGLGKVLSHRLVTSKEAQLLVQRLECATSRLNGEVVELRKKEEMSAAELQSLGSATSGDADVDQLASLSAQVEAYTRDIASKDAQMAAMQAQMRRLQDLVSFMEVEVVALQAASDGLRQEKSAHEAAVGRAAELEEDLERVTGFLTKAEQKLACSEKHREGSERVVSLCLQKIQRLRAELSSTQAAAATASEKMLVYELMAEQLRKEGEAKGAELAEEMRHMAAQRELLMAENEMLRRELREAAARASVQRSVEFGTLETQLANLRDQLSHRTQAVDSLRSELTAKSGQLRDAQGKVEAAKAEVARAAAEDLAQVQEAMGARVERLEDEALALSKQAADKEAALQAALSRLEALQLDMEQWAATQEEQGAELARLRAEAALAAESRSDLLARLDEREGELLEARSLALATDRELRALEVSIAEMQNEIQKHHDKAAAAEEAVEQLRSALARKEAAVARMQEDIAGKDRVAKATEEAMSKSKAAQESSQLAADTLQGKVVEMESMLASVKSKANAKVRRAQDAQAELLKQVITLGMQLEEKNALLDAAIDQATQAHMAAGAGRLKAELAGDKAAKEQEELKAEIQRLTVMQSSMQMALDTSKRLLTTTEEEAAAVENELHGRIAELQAELASQRLAAQSEMATHKAAAAADREQAGQREAVLLGRTASLQERVVELENELCNLGQEYEAEQEYAGSVERELSASEAERSRLELSLKDRSREASEARAHADMLRADLCSLTARQQDLVSQLSASQRREESLASELASLQVRVSVTEDRADSAELEVAALKTEVADLEKRVFEGLLLRGELEKKAKELAAAERVVQVLRAGTAEQESKCAQLEHTLASVTRAKEASDAKLASLDSQLREAGALLDVKEARTTALRHLLQEREGLRVRAETDARAAGLQVQGLLQALVEAGARHSEELMAGVAKLEQAQAVADAMREDLEDRDAELASVRAELCELNGALEAKEAFLARYRDTARRVVDAVRQQCAGELADKQAELERVGEVLEATRLEMEDQANSASARERILADTVEGLRAATTDAEAAAAGWQQQAVALKELLDATEETSAVKRADLESELQAARAAMSHAQLYARRTREEMNEITLELSQLQATAALTAAAAAEQSSRLEAAAATLAQRDAALAEREAQILDRDRLIASAREQLASAEADLASLSCQLSAREEESARAHAAVAELHERIASLEAEAARHAETAECIEGLVMGRDAMMALYEDASARAEALQGEAERLRAELREREDGWRVKVEDKEEALGKTEEFLGRYQAVTASVIAAIRAQDARELASATLEISSLRSSLARAEAEASSSSLEVSSLRSAMATLEASLAESHAALQLSEAQGVAISQDRAGLAQRVGALAVAVEERQALLEGARAESARLEAQLAELVASGEARAEELEATQRALEDARECVAHGDEEVRSLRTQVLEMETAFTVLLAERGAEEAGRKDAEAALTDARSTCLALAGRLEDALATVTSLRGELAEARAETSRCRDTMGREIESLRGVVAAKEEFLRAFRETSARVVAAVRAQDAEQLAAVTAEAARWQERMRETTRKVVLAVREQDARELAAAVTAVRDEGARELARVKAEGVASLDKVKAEAELCQEKVKETARGVVAAVRAQDARELAVVKEEAARAQERMREVSRRVVEAVRAQDAKELANVNKELSDARATLEGLREELEAAAEAAVLASAEREGMKAEVGAIQAQLDSALAENDVIHARLQAVRVDRERVVSQLSSVMAMNEQMESAMAILGQMLEESRDALAREEARSAELSTQVVGLEFRVGHLETGRVELLANVNELQRGIAERDAMSDAMRGELGVAAAERAALAAQLAVARDELALSTRAAEVAHQEVAALRRQIDADRAFLDKYKATATGVIDAIKARAAGEIAERDAVLEAVRAELASVRAADERARAGAESEVAELRARREEAAAHVLALRRALEEQMSEAEALRMDLAEASIKDGDKTLTIAVLRATLEEREAAAEELSEELAGVEGALEATERAAEEGRAAAAVAARRAADREAELMERLREAEGAAALGREEARALREGMDAMAVVAARRKDVTQRLLSALRAQCATEVAAVTSRAAQDQEAAALAHAAALSAMASDHATALSSLASDHASALSDLTNDHKAAMSALTAEMSAKEAASRSALEDLCSQLCDVLAVVTSERARGDRLQAEVTWLAEEGEKAAARERELRERARMRESTIATLELKVGFLSAAMRTNRDTLERKSIESFKAVRELADAQAELAAARSRLDQAERQRAEAEAALREERREAEAARESDRLHAERVAREMQALREELAAKAERCAQLEGNVTELRTELQVGAAKSEELARKLVEREAELAEAETAWAAVEECKSLKALLEKARADSAAATERLLQAEQHLQLRNAEIEAGLEREATLTAVLEAKDTEVGGWGHPPARADEDCLKDEGDDVQRARYDVQRLSGQFKVKETISAESMTVAATLRSDLERKEATLASYKQEMASLRKVTEELRRRLESEKVVASTQWKPATKEFGKSGISGAKECNKIPKCVMGLPLMSAVITDGAPLLSATETTPTRPQVPPAKQRPNEGQGLGFLGRLRQLL
eukprot:jgi/Mesvir1/13895/Mv16023-RA.2